MAIVTKLADNEMNYYQFKAKQILLQEKEDKEWKDFCKQIAPDCAACLAEKNYVKESKDVGIQTFPKKASFRTDGTPLQHRYQKEELPEALTNIKTRLEKIDLVLSKLFDEPHENEKVFQKHVLAGKKPFIQEKSHPVFTSEFSNEQALRAFEEQKKLQIQNSLKASLQNSISVAHKMPPRIKPRNCGFFLPHDLEVKRIAARKAYLASLQTKPKVAFQNKKQSSNEKVQTSQSKKSIPTRKKNLPKTENQMPKEDKETLIETFETGDYKTNKAPILCQPSTSSPMKSDKSKFSSSDNSSIMKLKSFIDSSDVIHREDSLRIKPIELVDKGTSPPNIEDSKDMLNKRATVISSLQKEPAVPKTLPQFVCGVTDIIKINPDRAKDITSKRDRFWKYLENTSQTAKGDFNPWILNETLAESIINDCINDVAKELTEMPSSIIKELYNQEFAQQVEI